MPIAPPFPIIPDPGHDIYQLYATRTSWWGMFKSLFRFSKIRQTISAGLFPGKWEGKLAMLPADFLIDGDLKIAGIFHARDITEHMPFEEIEAFLKT